MALPLIGDTTNLSCFLLWLLLPLVPGCVVFGVGVFRKGSSCTFAGLSICDTEFDSVPPVGVLDVFMTPVYWVNPKGLTVESVRLIKFLLIHWSGLIDCFWLAR